MAFVMWYVVVEGNIMRTPMSYEEALATEQKYRLQGYSAHMVRCDEVD